MRKRRLSVGLMVLLSGIALSGKNLDACSFKNPHVILTVDSNRFTHHELKDLATTGAVFVIDYPASGLSLKRIYELRELTEVCLRQVDESVLDRAEILELVQRKVQLQFQTSSTQMNRFELKEVFEANQLAP